MVKQTPRGTGKTPPPPKPRPKSSPKTFYLILGAVAVLGAVFLYYQTRDPGLTQTTTVDPSVPLPKAEGYLLGDASAPV